MWRLSTKPITIGDIVLAIVLFLSFIALPFVIGRIVDRIQKRSQR
jgi:hypothetical protein